MSAQTRSALCHCRLSYQSRPSYKPSPRIEIAPWTCQLLFFSCPKPRASHTSAVVKAPFCRKMSSIVLLHADTLGNVLFIAHDAGVSGYLTHDTLSVTKANEQRHEPQMLDALTKSCLLAKTSTALCLIRGSSTIACSQVRFA